MSYTIRLLSPKESVPPAPDVAASLKGEGFDAAVAGAPDGEGWEMIEVRLPAAEPIQVSRFLREGEENPVDEEIDGFVDELAEREETPALEQVMDALRKARQMLVVDVPESFAWGEERTAADALVEFLADSTEALIQADGEGFYDRMGDLLAALE